MTAEKVRENRLRRMADRQGFYLKKSARRDPLATDYGLYWVMNPDMDNVTWPHDDVGGPAPHFPWSGTDLDGVEEYLKTGRVE